MSKNKRFRMVNHDEFDYELNYIMDNYKRMHISDVCDLLNNFNDEIEQLKFENEKKYRKIIQLEQMLQDVER